MATVKLNLGGVIIEKELEELSQASEKETTIELSSDDLVVYKKDDFETYNRNLGDAEYKKGKTAGEEMTFKAMKNASGYEIEGYKDADTFVSTFKAKVIEETGKEPTEQLAKKDADIATLQGTINEIKTEFDTFKTGVTERETRGKRDGALSSFIPDEGVIVKKSISMSALKTELGIDVAFDDKNNAQLTKNGEVVKDPKTLQPIDPKEGVETYLTTLGLIKKADGGAGGGDDTGAAKGGSYEAFAKEMNDKGSEYAEGTQAFAYEMNKRIGDKTLVM